MVTASIEWQAVERAREIITLLMQQPITEDIALRVGQIDGFKHLEIVNGAWTGFEQDEYTTGEQHAWVEMKLLLAIGNFVVSQKLGRVYPGDMDFVLSGDKKNLKDRYQPDVAFVRQSRLQKTSGYFYGYPDLAIEIVSPSQSRPEFVAKANLYMKYGTSEVWLVFPKRQVIEVHTPDNVPVVYGVRDILSGSDLLPGLTLDVKPIFED